MAPEHDPAARSIRASDADHDPAARPIRASDAEREAAAARLRDAVGEGRLTLEELAERSEAAYAAVARSDLDQLLADLPAPGRRSRPRGPPASRRRPCDAERSGACSVGTGSRGPMRLSGETRIVNVMGGVDLDLSQATFEEGELTLRIYSLMGGATLHVPQGVHIDRSGFSLMGGDSIEAAETPPAPGAPVIHLHSVNVMGGNDVKRGPRRRRWPWQRHHLGHGGPHPEHPPERP